MKPTSLRIRNYNVGFGDCFLLTFRYASNAKPRNVLIDFGSTKTGEGMPRNPMLAIAKRIAKDCDGKLEILVASHRHSDHINGFDSASGEVIKQLTPSLVVQPWTEDPSLAEDAREPARATTTPAGPRALVARLESMHAVAQGVLDQVPQLKASNSVRRAVREQLEFLAATNVKNEAAVLNLRSMGKQVYAKFGDRLPVAKLIPGVKVSVLGPPTLVQSKGTTAAQTDEDPVEFWHLAAARFDAATGTKPLFPDAALEDREIPQEARDVIPQIDRMRSEEMLAIVRILDGAMNNTSLILLFEIGDTKLVFPGDAQLENWMYALKQARNRTQIAKKLADASFYKVGHHGSLNATPMTLWNAFAHRGAPGSSGRLKTMVSTAAGMHGHTETRTEVPRDRLITALDAETDLLNTQNVKSATEFWNDEFFSF